MNILAFKIVTLFWILSHVLDQYNGFVTLKDFELPDDGFDWGVETCWSDWSVLNYSELICAFLWFILCLHYWKCTVQKNKICVGDYRGVGRMEETSGISFFALWIYVSKFLKKSPGFPDLRCAHGATGCQYLNILKSSFIVSKTETIHISEVVASPVPNCWVLNFHVIIYI